MKYPNSWARSGNLTTEDSSGGVTFQAPFREAGSYTVQFYVGNPDLTQSDGQLRVEAEIVWSINGNSVTRIIDVINGTSITGRAEHVSVIARDRSVMSDGGFTYPLLILVAEGTRPSTQQPPYLTTQPELIAPSGDASIPVPHNAGAISVIVSLASAVGVPIPNPSDVRVEHVSGGGVVIKAYSPLIQSGWVPLSSGAATIDLFQSAAAPEALWSVTFGIDG